MQQDNQWLTWSTSIRMIRCNGSQREDSTWRSHWFQAPRMLLWECECCAAIGGSAIRRCLTVGRVAQTQRPRRINAHPLTKRGLGECMGYFGTSSSEEAGDGRETAHHWRSTISGSHRKDWWAMQGHREEDRGAWSTTRSWRRRGVGQPTSSIGRGEEEPTTMERGLEEGVRLFERLWCDQANWDKWIRRASGAVWSGRVASYDVGGSEETTNETQSSSGSLR